MNTRRKYLEERIQELETEIWRKKLVSGHVYGVRLGKWGTGSQILREPIHTISIGFHKWEIKVLKELLKYA